MSEVSATKCRISSSRPLCKVRVFALHHKFLYLYFELRVFSMYILLFVNPHLNLTSLCSSQMLFQTHQIMRASTVSWVFFQPVVYFSLMMETDAFTNTGCSVIWGVSDTTSSFFFLNRHCSCQGDLYSVCSACVNDTPVADKNPQSLLIWGYRKLQCKAEKAVVTCSSHEERKQSLIQVFSEASLITNISSPCRHVSFITCTFREKK